MNHEQAYTQVHNLLQINGDALDILDAIDRLLNSLSRNATPLCPDQLEIVLGIKRTAQLIQFTTLNRRNEA